MAWFRRKSKPAAKNYAPNPFRNSNIRSGFFSGDVDRLLSGWTTQSNSIDAYLRDDLRKMRARSRKLVRQNPFGKRFITAIKANVVGPNGVQVQAQSMRNGQIDTLANNAIEAAFKDWSKYHADQAGALDFVDIQNMVVSCAAQDGEFLVEKIKGPGKYGLQLRVIDPELLDVKKNKRTKNGEIRLGVEYDGNGRAIRYHFRRLPKDNGSGSYDTGESYTIRADRIIHGYIHEWPDQSRGVPWMHASLERLQHLDKYEEAAMVNARTGANSALLLSSKEGSDEYEGDEDAGNGNTFENLSAGELRDIGNREVTNWDPTYPHQMYEAFEKASLRSVSSGIGVSYHTVSNDLEGVNFSSIRAGVLEDREIYKGLQDWFIRSFVEPVYIDWINMALLKEVIKIGNTPLRRPPVEYHAATYQPRRWAWVDPQKDGAANKLAIDERLKSRSQVIRDQGNDPETTWREIEREESMMQALGIQPIQKEVADNAAENPGE